MLVVFPFLFLFCIWKAIYIYWELFFFSFFLQVALFDDWRDKALRGNWTALMYKVPYNFILFRVPVHKHIVVDRKLVFFQSLRGGTRRGFCAAAP